MGKFIDITGKIFGRLTVLSRAENRGSVARWNCRCDCGKELVIAGMSLRTGNTKSCRCLANEETTKRNTTHGLGSHAIYSIWQGMRKRVQNANCDDFKDYGGRGISIHPRWDEFTNFLFDMGERPSPRHSLDRIDTDGNYEPGNCRWVLPVIQANNKRNNRVIKIGFCDLTVAQWTRERGFSQKVIYDRLRLGWSDKDAVMKPLQRGHKRKAIPA